MAELENVFNCCYTRMKLFGLHLTTRSKFWRAWKSKILSNMVGFLCLRDTALATNSTKVMGNLNHGPWRGWRWKLWLQDFLLRHDGQRRMWERKKGTFLICFRAKRNREPYSLGLHYPDGQQAAVWSEQVPRIWQEHSCLQGEVLCCVTKESLWADSWKLDLLNCTERGMATAVPWQKLS